MTENYFDSHYMEYDEWYDKNRNIFEEELTILRRYKKFIMGESLEIGVGSGRFADALGIKYGIDISQNLLNIAKRRGIICKNESAYTTSFSDNYLDFIGVFFSLSFIDNLNRLFKEIRRILKEKGKILILFINKNGKLAKINNHKSFYKTAKYHAYFEITGYFQENSLNMIDIFSFDMGNKNIYVKDDPNFNVGDLILILGEKL